MRPEMAFAAALYLTGVVFLGIGLGMIYGPVAVIITMGGGLILLAFVVSLSAGPKGGSE